MSTCIGNVFFHLAVAGDVLDDVLFRSVLFPMRSLG